MKRNRETSPKIVEESPINDPDISVAPEPTEEQIRLRAYFLAERRAQLSITGDTHGDWLEARRQLFEESGHTPK